MKKIVISITSVLTFLILFIVTIQFVNLGYGNPGMAPNWLPIHIKSDGSIEPSNAPIRNNSNNQYFLTSNITAIGSTNSFHNIVIERDNIMLDGSNYGIDGLGNAWGIDVTLRNNVTIRNITISKFSGGILIRGCSNVIVVNCSILFNGVGISIQNSTSIMVLKNNLAENYNTVVSLGTTKNTIVFGNDMPYSGRTDMFLREGISLTHSSNNFIIANNIVRHSSGVHTLNSSGNYFYQNNLVDNQIQVKEELNGRDWWSTLNETAKRLNEAPTYLYLSVNNWDNSSVGNFWNDYSGSGSYVINENNIDHYPLLHSVDISTESLFKPQIENETIQNAPFPMAITVSLGIVAIVSVSLLVYFKKHRQLDASRNFD